MLIRLVLESRGRFGPNTERTKGGSGSSGLEFKRPAIDAASGGLRWLHA